MEDFLKGESRVLISTMARGIDGLDGVKGPLVINYDLPLQKDNYIRRIGCSWSRNHRIVINVVNLHDDSDDISIIQEIERFIYWGQGSTQKESVHVKINLLLQVSKERFFIFFFIQILLDHDV